MGGGYSFRPPEPEFPEEFLPLVVEFRDLVRLYMKQPRSVADPVHVGDTMLMWWSEDNEIGIGDSQNKAFNPILVSTKDQPDVKSVSYFGSEEEIQNMMTMLRQFVALHALSDV